MAAVSKDELRAEITDLQQQLDTLNDEENRTERFTQEQKDEWNRLNDLLTEKQETLDEFERRDARLLELSRHDENSEAGASFQTRRPRAVTGDDIYDLATVTRSFDDPNVENRDLHDRALRSISGAQFPHPRVSREDAQTNLERMIGDGADGDRRGSDVAKHILMTGSPQYRAAFSRYLAGGVDHLSDRDRSYLYRTMSLTAASGGYAVPYVLDPTLIPTSSGALNPYRAISSVATITVDEWRGVTHGGNAAAFQAEEAEVADDSLTLAQPTVSTEMARWFIPYSIEIGMDWAGFAGEMASVVQDEKDILEATKFAVGTGTNEPFGVVTGTSASVYTASDTDSIIVADLYGWQNALPVRFRSRASFTMRNEVANAIRQLTTASGPVVWIENLTQASSAQASTFTDARMGATLFGKPVYEASGQSGTLTTGQLIGVFGDFSYYKIVDRVGLTIERIDHLMGASFRPTGQRGLFAYWRVGAKVLNAAAFRCLKLA